ncbi:MAG TPA: S46 family peptidase [Rhodothermales bacterium]|nr:S46 family peptidase [Rhodothermales bacterium]
MRPYLSLAIVLLIALLYVAGCSTPRDVVEVTERPVPPPSTEETTPQAEETPAPEPMPDAMVQPGRFDKGKMWTFDNPPLDYFQEVYGFRPDSTWFEHARLGALRFSTYCSASFVSQTGLVMTNHHCGRESITEVTASGEDLLQNGFYAQALTEERKVEDLYVDQLLSISDVTRQIVRAGQAVRGDDETTQVQSEKAESIEQQMTAKAKGRDSTLYVEVVELYNGGQFSAYTFKRYDDVRLVMAPEQQLGYYGGDDDNFTYPRYALDMTFFRVYGKDGSPVNAEHFFKWSTTGASAGDPVFVVGNPGSTSRLSTVSQLEFERDYSLTQQLDALQARADLMDAYLEAKGDEAEDEVENTYFSITNSIKSTTGELGGLRDESLIAQRAASENQLQAAIMDADSLRAEYGDVLESIAELQLSKASVAPKLEAFMLFGTQLGSRLMTRALYGYYYDTLKRRGLPADRLEEIKEEALELDDWPRAVEQGFIAQRLREVQAALGANDPTTRRVLNGQSPDSVAAHLIENSALVDSARYAKMFETSYLNSGDPSVEIIEALAPLYFQVAGQMQSFQNREDLLNAQLARARFGLYGYSTPPDASFSLRIADGVVKGYEYNGTKAPPYTTFYGLYNDYYSYKGKEPWELPERWLHPPATFDLSTPFNIVSTADITGGNSGSPLLNQNLEIVGLVFDGNIESLPNTYLYRDTAARTISVDARGILEALDDIYDADRIVLELTKGQMANTEAEADAAMGSR